MAAWVLRMRWRRHNIKQLLGERNHLESTAMLRHQIGELKMLYKSHLAATDPRALGQPDQHTNRRLTLQVACPPTRAHYESLCPTLGIAVHRRS